MHLYRFFNPSAEGTDKCVLFISENRLEAINAYVERYHPYFRTLQVSKDFNSDNAILMEECFRVLEDGRMTFYEQLAININ